MPEPTDPQTAARESPASASGDRDDTAPAAPRTPPAALAFGPPAAAGEVGTLGPYRLVRRLGQGGMGAVFLATDTRLDRKVALKVMLPEFAADAAARERFLREARAAARVAHDNVVTVHEADERDGVPYIAMQLLQGLPLDQYLKAKGPPPLPHVIRVAREAALGLGAAHKLGLVHRDVKPANLWLEAPNGRVKVLDFGLAKPLGTDDELTRSGAVVGTPAFMSPEQARGLKVDHRTDLFSLGAVLYRLLTGRNPFQGPTTMAVLMALGNDDPPAVRELNPQVPDDLARLTHQLLAKRPDDRPGSADEVAKRLRAILESLVAKPAADPARGPAPSGSVAVIVDPVPDRPPVAEPLPLAAEDEGQTAPDAPKPRRGRWVAAGLLLGLLAVAAGVVVVRVKGPDGQETEVRVPEGSKVDVDAKGNVTVTLPPAFPPAAPGARALAPLPREGPEFVLQAGNALIDGFVILADGNTVVAGSRDGYLRVWNLSTRELIREYQVGKDPGSDPRCLAAHPDGRTVAVLTSSGALFTWDATTGREMRRYTQWPFGPTAGGWSIDFALGGELLIVPDNANRVVRAIDTATGTHRVLHRYPLREDYVLPRVSPDGRSVALATGLDSPVVLGLSGDGRPEVLSAGAWTAIPAFSPDGRALAFFGFGQRIHLHERGAPGPRMLFEPGPKTYNLAFSPDGRLLAGIGGTPGEVRVWAVDGGPAPTRVWKSPAGTGAAVRGHFTPDGTRLVTCHDNGTICVFRVSPEWSQPKPPYPPLDPAWLARVHELPPDEQVKEVSAELVRRNPRFDGAVVVEKGVGDRVWKADVPADMVEDLTPLHGFPHLTHVRAVPRTGPGKLWNLSPLRGLKLLALAVQSTPVWDVAPLKGMPLVEVFLDSTLVRDLSPLADSPLRSLALTGCPVADLSPLRGKTFDTLFLHNCTCVTDFSKLRGSTVRSLVLPPDFRGDLGPLAEVAVEQLWPNPGALRFSPEQRKALDGVRTLKTINGKPVAEYWKEIDAESPPKK